MFSRLVQKVSTFADHHQALFALIVTVSAISFSWGVENILENYVFPQDPVWGYSAAILGGLFTLIVTKKIVLQ